VWCASSGEGKSSLKKEKKIEEEILNNFLGSSYFVKIGM